VIQARAIRNDSTHKSAIPEEEGSVMRFTCMLLLAASVVLEPFAYADVSYQETTQITGGSLLSMLKLAGVFSSQAKQANAPVTSSIAVHGNRMVRTDPHATQIIDLDQQTITNIDRDKHTYTVMTFQQMQQAMANASAAAKQKAQQQGAGNPGAAPQMSFAANVTSSGATRSIDGRDAKESLVSLTMMSKATDGSNAQAGMAVTSEMWVVSDVPGMTELHAFQQRLASELSTGVGGDQISGMLKTQPGGTDALAQLKKESASINGVPVLETTRFGISADGKPLPAPSTAPVAQPTDAKAGEIATEVGSETATEEASNQVSKLGGFSRALGNSGLGALMRHKPAPKPSTQGSPDSSASSANAASAGVLLEAQTQMSNFSTAPVDSSLFQIPSGYTQLATVPLPAGQ
jgi:hypothetical protein